MPDITAAEIEQALDGMQVLVKHVQRLDTNTDLATGTVANPHGLAAELKREIDSYRSFGPVTEASLRDQLAARLQDGKIRVRSMITGPAFTAYVHDGNAAAAWFLDVLRGITGTCIECKGTGMTDGDGSCNCGSPADISVGYAHERYCGAEPCPAGCPVPAGD